MRSRSSNLTPAGQPSPTTSSSRPTRSTTSRTPTSSCTSGAASSPRSRRWSTGGTGPSFDALDGIPAAADADGDPHVWLDPALFAGHRLAASSGPGRRRPPTLRIFAGSADAYRPSSPRSTRSWRPGSGRLRPRRHRHRPRRLPLPRRRATACEQQADLRHRSPRRSPTPAAWPSWPTWSRRTASPRSSPRAWCPTDVAETLAREAGVDTAVLDPIEG